MKIVVKKATPAATAVLRQATAIAPSRLKVSDGLLPSKAHQAQSPSSDHNTGYAVDLTHDPKHGIDCAEIFQKLKEDKRVKYLIFRERFGQQSVHLRETVNTLAPISTTNIFTFQSMRGWAMILHRGSGGLTSLR